jgi:Ca-activated chloride channel family protein
MTGGRRWISLAALLLVGMQEPPDIHIDEEIRVELQQLYATVTRDNRPVLNLGAADFQIWDDGIPQQVVTFGRGDIPFSAVLLVDASASMQGDRLKTAVEGVRAFVSDIASLDEVQVMLFSDELLHRTPFSSDGATLLSSLAGVRARGGSAINDHLYLALKQLEERQGRRAVVLLSDGVDIESMLGMDDVRRAAQRSGILLYWIRLQEGDRRRVLYSSSWRSREDHARQLALLEQTAAESGGRIEPISSVTEVGPAFRRIVRELREQYVLGYYPSVDKNDGAWHKVQVEVRGGGYQVRTKSGYFDR